MPYINRVELQTVLTLHHHQNEILAVVYASILEEDYEKLKLLFLSDMTVIKPVLSFLLLNDKEKYDHDHISNIKMIIVTRFFFAFKCTCAQYTNLNGLTNDKFSAERFFYRLANDSTLSTRIFPLENIKEHNGPKWTITF